MGALAPPGRVDLGEALAHGANPENDWLKKNLAWPVVAG
jgi:hypothetical protein